MYVSNVHKTVDQSIPVLWLFCQWHRNTLYTECPSNYLMFNCAESNAVLRLKFQKLHQTVISSINPAGIIPFLFQEAVISAYDMRALLKIKDDPEQQCGELMALLHTSQHPQTFIQLYAAVKSQSHLKWLVERIDNESVIDLLQRLYDSFCHIFFLLHSFSLHLFVSQKKFKRRGTRR